MFTLKCEYCGFEQIIKKKLDKYTYYELIHCKHLWCPCNKCKEQNPDDLRSPACPGPCLPLSFIFLCSSHTDPLYALKNVILPILKPSHRLKASSSHISSIWLTTSHNFFGKNIPQPPDQVRPPDNAPLTFLSQSFICFVIILGMTYTMSQTRSRGRKLCSLLITPESLGLNIKHNAWPILGA